VIRSWQTTIAGLGCIGAGVALYLMRASSEGLLTAAALVAAGLGLLRAKDASVHSTADQVVQASGEAKDRALDAANGR
jgi:hypothetical protein